MNEETKILQYKLNKDYLTIDDVIRYGGIGKIYLVIGKDPTIKYWLCKNKDGNVLVPADKEPYYSEISHRLLIIGNGFDLHCGANSTYNAFFDEQFGISLAYKIRELYSKNTTNNKVKIEKEFIDNAKDVFNTYYCKIKIPDIKEIFCYIELEFLAQYKSELLSEINKLNKEQKIEAATILKQINEKIVWLQGSYSKWNIVFFLAKLFYLEQDDVNWSDVEKMIFYVINWLITGKHKRKNKKFDKLLKKLFENEEDLSHNLLLELEIFENEFAIFIQRQETYKYYKNAKSSIESFVQNTENLRVILDVFDFNYSLNQYDANDFLGLNSKIILHSWTNIHGIADYKKSFNQKNDVNIPAPIFGIDLHEILDKSNNLYKDPRLKFTKSYRLSTNHVNNIRTKDLQEKIDIITIVGHSLDKADYSYFESFFDKYDLYNSDIVLECYYAEDFDREEDYTRQVDALLTDYGNTLKNVHGENIFNKLMLEQRLKIIPYSS